MAVRLAPRGEALQSTAEFLAGRAALEVLFPLAILAPAKRKPEKLEAGFPCVSVPTERDEPRLGRRQLQAELLSPLPQHIVEAFCLCLVFERTYQVVRIPHETRFASTVPFDHFCTPHIEPIVQEHIGEYG